MALQQATNTAGAVRVITELKTVERREEQRRAMLEEYFSQLTTIFLTYQTLFRSQKLTAKINEVLTIHQEILALGQPSLPREIIEMHRRSELSHITKVTGNAVTDYGKQFSSVKQFLDMAKKETNLDEIKRNLEMARSYLLRTLRAELEFITQEKKLTTVAVEEVQSLNVKAA